MYYQMYMVLVCVSCIKAHLKKRVLHVLSNVHGISNNVFSVLKRTKSPKDEGLTTVLL